MKPSSDISRLLEIMTALRHPQTGCPWDIVQSSETILPYTIEEAYEVADAVRRDNLEDLCEELGDLLLQVVYHARIAEEKGSFSFKDVVSSITEKMIRRHPHVFGSHEERRNGREKGAWEKIKAQEKAEKLARKADMTGKTQQERRSCLDGISPALPPWIAALKLQHKAAKTGFDWPDVRPVLEKLAEEMAELEEAISKNDVHDITGEYGDLLFTIINLGRKLKLDPETALARTNRKFRRRFLYMEQKLQAKRQSLAATDLEEMETLWTEAKTESPEE